MQKKLIALAVAGLVSGGAFAQSNVTIYGIADVYAANFTASGKSSQTMIESGGMAGSRIGFKGEEALGNGLKAIFGLEYNLAIDTNSGIGDANTTIAGSVTPGGATAAGNASRWTGTQARNTFVGLTGNFGTVVGGRLQSAPYYFSIDYSPFGGSAFDNSNHYTTFFTAGTSARFSNALGYISPTFNGFTLEWDHARVTEDANHAYSTPVGTAAAGSSSDSTGNVLSAKYANGPLKAQLVYVKLSAAYTSAADDVKETGLGASYDFKSFKLMGLYKTRRADNLSASGNNKQYNLSVAVPVSANGTVIAAYARSTLDNNNVADDNATGFGVQYRHALSKRTTAYVGYTRVSNSSGGTDGITTSAGLTPTAGGNASITGLGLNHAF